MSDCPYINRMRRIFQDPFRVLRRLFLQTFPPMHRMNVCFRVERPGQPDWITLVKSYFSASVGQEVLAVVDHIVWNLVWKMFRETRYRVFVNCSVIICVFEFEIDWYVFLGEVEKYVSNRKVQLVW